MNLDSVTVGHVITVDFGPDCRSRMCKARDWLQNNDTECGVRRYGFSEQEEARSVFIYTVDKYDFKTSRNRMRTGLDWLFLALTSALFVAIEIYAG